MGKVTLLGAQALILFPTVVVAGTSYDLIFRDPMQPTSAPVVSRHFVQGGEVRVELLQNGALIFNEQAMYVIDYAAKTMRVLPTRDQSVAKMTDQIGQIRAKAQTAPAEQRATMEHTAQGLEEILAGNYRTVRRDYAATARSEMVDGRRCQVWTEAEEKAKRLELCVADTASVPGGDLMLAGIRRLSRYAVFGSLQALGVQFGYGEWWAGIESLKGIPVLIREFKDEHAISELTIGNVHADVPAGSLLEIPKDYPTPEAIRGMPSIGSVK